MTARTVTIRGDSIPVVLPNKRDARLHTAAVIISIHLIGMFALGFKVSIPQILSAILTAALVDVAITFFQTRRLVWPASGMLTGSGVALILRLVGAESHDYWTWDRWWWFAGIAGGSLLTKFVIRWRGMHIFNPSNVGLVVAFIVFGKERIEPLDFWWAPLDFWMLLAYLIIIGGGIVITRRLHLLEMAVVFWVVLAVGLGVLALSGHCMTASWSPTPVCDGDFWRVLVTSPEVLVFLFFMITDPRTIPMRRPARTLFSVTIGVLATVLIAPQTIEFGAKVALLSSLALLSPLRWLYDRVWAPVGEKETSGLGQILSRSARPGVRPIVQVGRGALVGLALSLCGLAVVVAGAPARAPAVAAPPAPPAVEVDRDSIPEVAIDESVSEIAFDVTPEFAADLAVQLVENLAIEGRATLEADGGLLGFADAGARLAEMQALLDTALATDRRPVDVFSFDALRLRVADEPGQSGAAFIFEGVGTVETIIYDPAGEPLEVETSEFDSEFMLLQVAGERWLIVEVSSSG
ncbi:MAG TPA: hypothetical protein VFS66_11030 [Acidimicrobiia bacterium]|nr:hypothetical protein [Acidimicrobiia bacterium]